MPEQHETEDATAMILGGGRQQATQPGKTNGANPGTTIDWGGSEDEIRHAQEARRQHDDPSLHTASTKPVPDPADHTTFIQQANAASQSADDSKGHTMLLSDASGEQRGQSAVPGAATDAEPAQASQEADVPKQQPGTLQNDSASRKAANPPATKRPPAEKRPRISKTIAIGLAAVAIVIAAIVGAPALEDYLDSQRDVTYTIEFEDSNTGKAVADAVEETQKNRTEAVAEAPEIEGYQLMSGAALENGEERDSSNPAVVELTLDADSEQGVKFSYAKLVSYKVRHLDRDTNEEVTKAKTEKSQLSGTKVTEEAPEIDGYNLDSDAKASITLGNKNSKNVITFYYTKIPEPEPEPVYVAPAYTYTPTASSGGSSGGSSSKKTYEKSDGYW